jgi:hypothetical protein
MSDLFDDVKKRCIDNSRSVNELDKENISICTHMRSLEDELLRSLEFWRMYAKS